MNDERPSEDAPPGLRRSRGWALAALMLWLTAFWLDWWQVRYQDLAGNAYDTTGVGPFRWDGIVAHDWGPWMSGILLAVACLLIFVRISGRSWLYEPPAWQRDLLVAALLVAAAWLSTAFWHTADPLWDHFWHTTQFHHDGTALENQVVTRPGLGWWLAASGLVCILLGWWQGRSRVP